MADAHPVRSTLESSTVDEAVEILGQAFTGGDMRLADSSGDLRFKQDYLAAPGVGVVQQSIIARLEASATESDRLSVVWTERGRMTYRFGRHEVSGALMFSGERPLEATVENITAMSVLFDRADFQTRARNVLGRPTFTVPPFVVPPSARHVDTADHRLRPEHCGDLRNQPGPVVPGAEQS